MNNSSHYQKVTKRLLEFAVGSFALLAVLACGSTEEKPEPSLTPPPGMFSTLPTNEPAEFGDQPTSIDVKTKEPTPTSMPTPSPTPTQAPTPTAEPTSTPIPTATPAPGCDTCPCSRSDSCARHRGRNGSNTGVDIHTYSRTSSRYRDKHSRKDRTETSQSRNEAERTGCQSGIRRDLSRGSCATSAPYTRRNPWG